MRLLLLALFIGVPLLEIAAFIRIGGWIGLWPTLALVLLTAVAGSWLLRLQGLSTLGRLQRTLARGELPIADLFDGACVLLAGALLLTPGFVTDAAGLMLFLPPVRAWLRRRLARHVTVRAAGPRGGGGDGDGIIEGEWEEVVPPPPAVERQARERRRR